MDANSCESTPSPRMAPMVNSVQSKQANNLENKKILNNAGLKFLHLNVNRLVTIDANKFHEIRHLLSTNDNIDVICLSETFLNDSFDENQFILNGYQQFRRDRKNQEGGGILIFIRDNIPCVRRHDLELEQSIESIWLEIRHSVQKSFLFGYHYRPPSSLSDWFNKVENTLESTFRENKETILLGDFNINYINQKSVNSNWNNITSSFSLEQLVNQPTRVTENTATIIDHIYTNSSSNITEMSIPKVSISDHYAVCFTRKHTSKPLKRNKHTLISYRSQKHFDEKSFRESLEELPWSTIDVFDDPDDALDIFNSMFKQVLDSHAPLRTKRVKHEHQPDWFNEDIANAIKLRDAAKEALDNELFKYWRGRVKSLIKNAKKSFYSQNINIKEKNPKKLWKNLKELSNKSKVHQNIIINDDCGNPITDNQTSADTFNTFFTNIFKKAPQNRHKLEDNDKIILEDYIKQIDVIIKKSRIRKNFIP